MLTKTNSSERQEGYILVEGMKQQSAESSDIDADLVDDLDRALKMNQTVQ